MTSCICTCDSGLWRGSDSWWKSGRSVFPMMANSLFSVLLYNRLVKDLCHLCAPVVVPLQLFVCDDAQMLALLCCGEILSRGGQRSGSQWSRSWWVSPHSSSWASSYVWLVGRWSEEDLTYDKTSLQQPHHIWCKSNLSIVLEVKRGHLLGHRDQNGLLPST